MRRYPSPYQFVAVKHHWYWQFNFIFQRLEVTKPGSWDGHALYIEEDNYVAPDLLAVLAQMSSIAENQCGGEKCGILNLGLKTQEAVSDSGAGFETRGHVRRRYFIRATRGQPPLILTESMNAIAQWVVTFLDPVSDYCTPRVGTGAERSWVGVLKAQHGDGFQPQFLA